MFYIKYTDLEFELSVTLASKKLKPLYDKVWEYIQQYPCEFQCFFDNVTIYKWQDGTWKVYREFKFKDQ